MPKQRFHLDHNPFLIQPGKKTRLKDFDPADTNGIKDKKQAKEALLEDVSALAEAQDILWAAAEHSVLIILQALDAAGKDSTIKHVMSGVNPQGCAVHGFRAPSEEERQHDFLWRPVRFLPSKGRITLFNRSYYEEVLVVRVHPEFLESQRLPPEQRELKRADLWRLRYESINTFEKYLTNNGTSVIKFFLNVSKDEQKQRFLERLNEPEKNWKFSAADVRERAFWDDYQTAYEEMLNATSTPWAPWYVIPADKKWFTRACVADIITSRLRALNSQYPQINDKQKQELADARQVLEEEKA